MSFFSQTTVSTCYAISLQKVYKLSGKFINLIECLTSSPRQGNNTLRSVHGIVEGWGGGVGWKSLGGGGGGGGGGKIVKGEFKEFYFYYFFSISNTTNRKQNPEQQANKINNHNQQQKYLITAYNIK